MDIKLLNPLTLAYMGDAVLDQHVREYIVLKLQSKPKSYTKAKNTDIQTYRKSSGLEAVIGYLYLDHQEERLENLLDMIVQTVNER